MITIALMPQLSLSLYITSKTRLMMGIASILFFSFFLKPDSVLILEFNNGNCVAQ